jgi:alkylated DNA nucleotide flippase Atl1
MPPIRTESSQKSANQEGRILLALDDIKNGRIKSIRAAAKLYGLPRSTLGDRAQGVIARVDTRANSHKLTQLEEDSLVEWIFSIDTRGAAPRRATVREIADILLVARGITPPPTVGINWVSNFIKRRDKLRTRFSRRYDYQRALNEDPKVIKEWFLMVQRTIEENGIQPEDIYNFDKTGFAIGLISAQKVVTRAEYYGRRSILQPGNRE